MPGLIEHLESHLGEIVRGCKPQAYERYGVQIVEFHGGPIQGVTTWMTLGLSNSPLCSAKTNTPIRQELIFSSWARFPQSAMPGIVGIVAHDVIDSGHILSRGEVLGPHGSLFQYTQMTALYAAAPVYWPDSFDCFSDDSGCEFRFLWLVPITTPEAMFVKERGWSEFEQVLLNVNPDLLDFSRPSVV